jgi:hypothetical protein
MQRLSLVFFAVSLVIGISPAAHSQLDNESPQLRGPLHEAFAQPLEGGETPGATVSRSPPAPLQDVPAAVKPSSSTAIWIAGYWGWDDRAGKFAWVTGVWRIPPPGMRWVPGYWSQSGDEWRWVRGFWFASDQPHVRYRPTPPPPQDEPDLAELDDDQFAVRGYWSYAGGKYIWNRGFKAKRKPGWVWMPSRYTWTPAGSLFLPGYWDYELQRRGFLFAPPSATSLRQATQSPTSGQPLPPKAAINTAALPDAIIANVTHGHYYYGADSEKLALPISELARSRGAGLPATEIAAGSLPRIAKNAEAVRLLAVQRSRFESSAGDDRSGARLVFNLPAPPEPINLRTAQTSPQEAAGRSVPGVTGRRVPGAGGRNVPGVSGRVVPGVDTSVPGVTGPGAKDGKQ